MVEMALLAVVHEGSDGIDKEGMHGINASEIDKVSWC